MKKKCTKCGKPYPPTKKYFYPWANKCGLHSWCRKCYNADMRIRLRKWRKENPERARAHWQKVTPKQRRAKRLRQYGLTEDSFQAKIKKQNGGCAVCRKETEKLVVDHDHKTGLTRGLLCRNCNVMLGNAFDDPKILKRGIAYLKKWMTIQAKAPPLSGSLSNSR